MFHLNFFSLYFLIKYSLYYYFFNLGYTFFIYNKTNFYHGFLKLIKLQFTHNFYVLILQQFMYIS